MYITITRTTISEFVPPTIDTPTTCAVKKMNSMEDIIAVTCAFTRTRFMFKALLECDKCSAAIGFREGLILLNEKQKLSFYVDLLMKFYKTMIPKLIEKRLTLIPVYIYEYTTVANCLQDV